MNIKNSRTFFIFIAIIGLYWTSTYIFQKVITTPEIIHDHYIKKLPPKTVEKIVENNTSNDLFNYIFVAIKYFLKITVTSFLLYIGYTWVDKKVNFWKLFEVVAIVEIVFIFQVLIKIIFFLSKTNYSFEEINNFHPLSLFSFFDGNAQEWLQQTLITLNVFEVIYWIALAFGLSKINTFDFEKNFLIVLSTYCVGLLFWLALNILIFI